MKYLDFFTKIFQRYKIIIYGFLGTLILLEYKLVAYTLYAFSLYEFISLILSLYVEKKHMDTDNFKNHILKNELALSDKKEDLKILKVKIKKENLK